MHASKSSWKYYTTAWQLARVRGHEVLAHSTEVRAGEAAS